MDVLGVHATSGHEGRGVVSGAAWVVESCGQGLHLSRINSSTIGGCLHR
jgi:hypothetical protein